MACSGFCGDSEAQGDWFFDPATFVTTHIPTLNVPGFSLNYINNPYLAGNNKITVTPPDNAVPGESHTFDWILTSDVGTTGFDDEFRVVWVDENGTEGLISTHFVDMNGQPEVEQHDTWTPNVPDGEYRIRVHGFSEAGTFLPISSELSEMFLVYADPLGPLGVDTEGNSYPAFTARFTELAGVGHDLGYPLDNDDDDSNDHGRYVHEVNGLLIQDFYGPGNGYVHPYASLVRGPDPADEVFLLKEGFWYRWMSRGGWYQYGHPINDEFVDTGTGFPRQDFSSGIYFLWDSVEDEVKVYTTAGDVPAQHGAVSFSYAKGETKSSYQDGIYHSGQRVTGFDEPVDLVTDVEMVGFYAVTDGQQIYLPPFTVTGDATIAVGVPSPPQSYLVELNTVPGDVLPGETFQANVLIQGHPGEYINDFRVVSMDQAGNLVETLFGPTGINLSHGLAGAYTGTIATAGNYQLAVQYSLDGGATWHFLDTDGTTDNPLELEVGEGGPGELLVPGQYPTIGAAVQASQPHDVILVDCGVYPETEMVISHPLSILANAPYQVQPCVIIDGGGASRLLDLVFSSPSLEEVRLEGLTFRNGEAPAGGGGGAIRADQVALAINGCTFENNAGESGGAIRATGSSLQISNCRFLENRAREDGGAVSIASGTNLLTGGCWFEWNGHDDRFPPRQLTGGAISAHGNSTITAMGCFFDGNDAFAGGGIYLAEGGSVSLEPGVGTRNEADTGAFLETHEADSVHLGSSMIVRNRQTGVSAGSAVFVSDTRSTVSDLTLVFDSLTIADNESSPGGAGLIVDILAGPSLFRLESTIAAFNIGTAVDLGGVVPDQLVCNDFHGNTAGDWVGDLAFALGSGGNISADPVFCEPEIFDYIVQPSSPCLAANSTYGCDMGMATSGCLEAMPPSDVAVNYSVSGNELSWDLNWLPWSGPFPDFLNYRVYKGAGPDFVPGPSNLVAEPASSPWFDAGGNYGDHYKVSALYDLGYESVAVGPQGVSSAPGFPVAVTQLHQNRPNPFNPQTTISFDLPRAMEVSLKIYDISGRLVHEALADQVGHPGRNQVIWAGRDRNGRRLPSGTYFYRLKAGGYEETRRMTLLK